MLLVDVREKFINWQPALRVSKPSLPFLLPQAALDTRIWSLALEQHDKEFGFMAHHCSGAADGV
jgi:hypothetical protein